MLLLKENGNWAYSLKCLVFLNVAWVYLNSLGHYTFLLRINTFEYYILKK